ncbi:hypothetical protein HFP69_35445 [Streptomyces sp. ARC12]|uniref:hypothetical protein n=1 Tax=Streptomyces sp. ARC12 TaxID=2724151 RepID=UPI0038575E14
MTLSILTFAPAAEPEDNGYTVPPAASLPTRAGAAVHIHKDNDGSLSSICTGCGEYAWTPRVTQAFAQEHADICIRPPRAAA